MVRWEVPPERRVAFTIVLVGTGSAINLGAPTGNGSTHTLQTLLGTVRVQSLATEAPRVFVDDSGDTASRPQVTAQISHAIEYLSGTRS